MLSRVKETKYGECKQGAIPDRRRVTPHPRRSNKEEIELEGEGEGEGEGPRRLASIPRYQVKDAHKLQVAKMREREWQQPTVQIQFLCFGINERRERERQENSMFKGPPFPSSSSASAEDSSLSRNSTF